MALRKTVLTAGLGVLAVTAIAASHAKPLEAPLPEHGVPAAQHVENVLRATYVLPTGRAESLAAFLQQNAAAGIDVRFDNDQLTVVAPADVQKALGGFIDKCLGKSPRDGLLRGDFGSPYEYRPSDPSVPEYEDPSVDDFGASPTPIRQRTPNTPDDGFKQP
jgi:hypothetical protein